jgi:hypothetical protein
MQKNAGAKTKPCDCEHFFILPTVGFATFFPFHVCPVRPWSVSHSFRIFSPFLIFASQNCMIQFHFVCIQDAKTLEQTKFDFTSLYFQLEIAVVLLHVITRWFFRGVMVQFVCYTWVFGYSIQLSGRGIQDWP